MSGGGASSFGTTQTSGTAPESLLGKREQKKTLYFNEGEIRQQNAKSIILRIYLKMKK